MEALRRFASRSSFSLEIVRFNRFMRELGSVAVGSSSEGSRGIVPIGRILDFEVSWRWPEDDIGRKVKSERMLVL